MHSKIIKKLDLVLCTAILYSKCNQICLKRAPQRAIFLSALDRFPIQTGQIDGTLTNKLTLQGTIFCPLKTGIRLIACTLQAGSYCFLGKLETFFRALFFAPTDSQMYSKPKSIIYLQDILINKQESAFISPNFYNVEGHKKRG